MGLKECTTCHRFYPEPPGNRPEATEIWAFAKVIAESPEVKQKIWHSKALVKLRRAFGSPKRASTTVVKGLGQAVTWGFKQIPVPVLKDLLATLSDAASAAIRSAKHKHNVNKGGDDTATKVKYMWKHFDVKEMDRYRWKVTNCLENINKLAAKLSADQEKPTLGKLQSLAYEYNYAFTRVRKLNDRCDLIQAAVDLTRSWLNDVERGLVTWELDYMTKVNREAKSPNPEQIPRLQKQFAPVNAQESGGQDEKSTPSEIAQPAQLKQLEPSGIDSIFDEFTSDAEGDELAGNLGDWKPSLGDAIRKGFGL